jgi:alpha-amylase
MSKVKLIFGTTNTQPVGTPDEEVEAIYQRAYKPFIRELYNFPEVPVTLHYSGTLLHWMQERHSEFIDVLAEMVGRRQVELLGGPFYDPVLPLIPRADALGQIESLTTLIRKLFGRRPRGSWITEQVWEPSLASTLKNSGMEYIFLDDYHFLTGGLSGNDLNRPVITEDQGKTIIVFPNSRDLQETMCNGDPESVIEYLRGRTDDEDDDDRVVVAIYDGWRFGGTDDSGRICYGDKWLHRLLTLIRDNRDWIQPVNPWRYLRRPVSRTRAYFPSTSYEEMMYWTLSPQRQKDLVGVRDKLGTKNGRSAYMFGGFFRHFLTRYPESNLLYAKMQYTHILVNQLRGDKYRKLSAREELWKGQCHNAYWHGRSGGIYKNHLRKMIYASLIEAEKVTRDPGVFIPSIITVDFDMDGLIEYLYQGQDLNAYVHVQGGILIELDYLPSPWNYLDTLGRRPEVYHTAEIAALGYDTYTRKSFIDHFLDPDDTLDLFCAAQQRERGRFHCSMYEVRSYNREQHTLSLAANGMVKDDQGEVPIELHKVYRFRDTTVVVEYSLRNLGNRDIHLVFAVEMNFAFESMSDEDLHVYQNSDGTGVRDIGPQKQALASTASMLFEDLINRVSIQLTLSEPTDLWCTPVETVAQSENGLESYYQSSCVVPRYELALPADAEWRADFTLTLGKLS